MFQSYYHRAKLKTVYLNPPLSSSLHLIAPTTCPEVAGWAFSEPVGMLLCVKMRLFLQKIPLFWRLEPPNPAKYRKWVQ